MEYPSSEGVVKQDIPKNYYCEFSIDLKDAVVYGVEIYRTDRYQNREKIDIDVIV
jgi:hypothetical protein